MGWGRVGLGNALPPAKLHSGLSGPRHFHRSLPTVPLSSHQTCPAEPALSGRACAAACCSTIYKSVSEDKEVWGFDKRFFTKPENVTNIQQVGWLGGCSL